MAATKIDRATIGGTPARAPAPGGGAPNDRTQRTRQPAENDSPALASIRLASGETAYVELSPEGRRRIADGRGATIQFVNSDVAERHRHDRGIIWMSLNRLMRLRAEEEARRTMHVRPEDAQRRGGGNAC